MPTGSTTPRLVCKLISGGEGVAVRFGKNEVYSSPLLFAQLSCAAGDIDHDLRYEDSRRPVIQPRSALGPGGLAHPLGPTPLMNATGSTSAFELIRPGTPRPATTRLVCEMTILTPSGDAVTILPRENNNFVTVADVQRAVLGWMRGASIPGISLSGIGRIHMLDEDGVEARLWMWRGLKKHGLESDVWELFL